MQATEETVMCSTPSSSERTSSTTTKTIKDAAKVLTPPSSREESSTLPHSLRRHAATVFASWEKLIKLRSGEVVVLDGESLDIASVLAVAKYGVQVALGGDGLSKRIQQSCDVLAGHLSKGHMVYGVNTGFGGSADARTNQLQSLQIGLVQHQNSGVLSHWDTSSPTALMTAAGDNHSKAMPTTWVRGLMLARVNSIIRGHSAVSMPIIEAIVALLEKQITPVIPKRGSISASGDLIPLSYLAGVIQGNPDIFVRMPVGNKGCILVSADEALRTVEMKPIVLEAKEGLGLLNGTAASTSVASLAIYECNQLILLTQVLTAMGCEAMKGSAESFHPFIAVARPHEGQVEAAANILAFLTGSRLAQGTDETKDVETEGLAQDRYALRTASQWLGPQLEDLMLATDQIAAELNSTTDNPLVDIEGDRLLHGGNFQAASITSAMEKSRLAMQMVAKLLFAQATEIINPAMNRGLPPNLCADQPSTSFTCKGIDITMAAYHSEIAFLSNPVSTHVNSAEMNNQQVNSLALISSRYTLKVVDILSLMCASYLFMVCQALDLRVLQARFLEQVNPLAAGMVKEIADRFLVNPSQSEKLSRAIWTSLVKDWDASTTLDLPERATRTAESAAATLVRELRKCTEMKCSAFEMLTAIETWTNALSEMLRNIYDSNRQEMFEKHSEITPPYLGQGSVKLYLYVRQELGIPLHRGLVDDPTYVIQANQKASTCPKERKTIGSLISRVYESIQTGAIHDQVMVALKKPL